MAQRDRSRVESQMKAIDVNRGIPFAWHSGLCTGLRSKALFPTRNDDHTEELGLVEPMGIEPTTSRLRT